MNQQLIKSAALIALVSAMGASLAYDERGRNPAHESRKHREYRRERRERKKAEKKAKKKNR